MSWLLFTLSVAAAQVACPLGTKISAGGDHALILLPGASEAYAVGDNSHGQLGAGHNQAISSRVKIDVGHAIEAVAAGSSHSLLVAGGKVFAVGDNRHGQLGLGSIESHYSPMQMPLPDGLEAAAASAGCWFSLILMESGEVFGVGYNYNGQLGLNRGDDWRLLRLRKLPLPGKAKSVSAGCTHSLVLLESGEVYGLGENWYGQLGLGNKEDQTVPRKMLLNGTAKAISSGTTHSVVLLDNGEVYSTGDNLHGQLALGHNDATLTPRRIVLEGSAAAVAAGDLHTLVALEDGRCFASGDNGSGQLGVAGVQDPAVHGVVEINGPVRMSIHDRVLDVDAGWSYSLMVAHTGVFTAGYNLRHGSEHLDGAHPLLFEEPPLLL